MCVGMNIDIASIDMVSEVNMVSPQLVSSVCKRLGAGGCVVVFVFPGFAAV